MTWGLRITTVKQLRAGETRILRTEFKLALLISKEAKTAPALSSASCGPERKRRKINSILLNQN